MTKKAGKQEPSTRAERREFTDEFRREAVQMMLDGHTAASVAGRLGLAGTNLLYRWKRDQLERSGPVATSLEARVRELETELHRAERERDILKKALPFSGGMKVFMFDKISEDVRSFGALPRKAWMALGILELVCTVGLSRSQCPPGTCRRAAKLTAG